jgi:hypothetical protein
MFVPLDVERDLDLRRRPPFAAAIISRAAMPSLSPRTRLGAFVPDGYA